MSIELKQPYKHDCDHCIWVTWIAAPNPVSGSEWANMYFCPKTHSVIIRFSDEPEDYWSAPIGVMKKGPLQITTKET